ncbi:MAG: YdcF family protein [Bifidobacteriaceae bacterium]|jgi:uncharacterized SAM-binding protein YcdF (DUF218 family)|nr:YdcF family protein [Bifidobacteriaceae bacterium]
MWYLAIAPAACLGVFAFSLWRDPRKVRTGVYLLSAIATGGLGLFISALGAAGRGGSGTDGGQMDAKLLLGGVFALLLAAIVLGIMLVLNGLTMLRREDHRLANALSLLLGAAILGYLGLGLAALGANAAGMFMWTAVLGLPIGYFGFGFLAYLLYSGAYQFATRHWERPVAAVVVLGSGLVRGQVPPLLASRLDRGRAIWARSQERGRRPVLVVSGGQGPDEPRAEADAMADYLAGHGVQEAAIRREGRSRNTRENLAFAKTLLADDGVTGRVAIVTNNFHAFRAALLMRRAGIPGYVIGSPTAGYYWPSATIREYIAICWDHKALNAVMAGLACLPLIARAMVAIF